MVRLSSSERMSPARNRAITSRGERSIAYDTGQDPVHVPHCRQRLMRRPPGMFAT